MRILHLVEDIITKQIALILTINTYCILLLKICISFLIQIGLMFSTFTTKPILCLLKIDRRRRISNGEVHFSPSWCWVFVPLPVPAHRLIFGTRLVVAPSVFSWRLRKGPQVSITKKEIEISKQVLLPTDISSTSCTCQATLFDLFQLCLCIDEFTYK